MVVLPPLCGGTQKLLDATMKLHAQRVNLLALETVDGLECLLGVDPIEKSVALKKIRGNVKFPENSPTENSLIKLGGLTELIKGNPRTHASADIGRRNIEFAAAVGRKAKELHDSLPDDERTFKKPARLLKL